MEEECHFNHELFFENIIFKAMSYDYFFSCSSGSKRKTLMDPVQSNEPAHKTLKNNDLEFLLEILASLNNNNEENVSQLNKVVAAENVQ